MKNMHLECLNKDKDFHEGKMEEKSFCVHRRFM